MFDMFVQSFYTLKNKEYLVKIFIVLECLVVDWVCVGVHTGNPDYCHTL